MAVDITDQQRMQEELLHARKMESIGRLTGGIAHDFNNVLAVIVGNLDLMEESRSTDRPTRTCIDALRRSVGRGADLTHRLLAFARRQPLDPVPADVNGVIRDLSAMLDRLLGKTIETRTELARDLRPVFVDVGELENALLNIAVNARDAMPDGGTLTISSDLVRWAADTDASSCVAIAFRDTGCGMSEEVRSRAVEPFFTTKRSGEGTGLGLSTVYGFAAQSGGRLEIESAVGHGTTMTIMLPTVEEGVASAG